MIERRRRTNGEHLGRRLLDRLHQADRLVRIHAFGFLVVWPLLGAAAVAAWTPRLFIGIVAVTFCFNTFGSMLNDIVDLPVDRTNPLRARDPLVRGTISRRQALMLALLQVPLMAAAHWAAGFALWTLAPAVAGLVGMAVYDLWSKTTRMPPVVEASQAAAGALLVVYGALVTGQPLTTGVWPVALSAAAFILFVNAFHGGLRDIENDRRCAQRTTPIWLGCRGVEEGRVHIALAMSLYSATLQGLLIGLAIWVTALTTTDRAWTAAVVAAAAANLLLFVGEHAVRKPAWDVLLRVHVVSAAVPLMLAFAPRLGGPGTMLLFAAYLGPMLIMDRSHLAGSSLMAASQPEQMSPIR